MTSLIVGRRQRETIPQLWTLVIGLTFFGVFAGESRAQQFVPEIAPSNRIQVRSSAFASKWRTGLIEKINGDSIVFRDENRGDVTTLSLAELQNLRLSGGPRPKGQSVAKKAALGFGIGLGGSLVFWAAAKESDADLWGSYQESHLVSASVGAGVGALIGFLKPGERWIDVRIQPKVQATSLASRMEVRISWPRRQ